MIEFSLDTFVEELRQAASSTNPADKVKELMVGAFASPEAIRKGMPDFTGVDEKILFEDESVSIWYCGFKAGTHIPPHDHQTTAIIGIYFGTENNHIYESDGGKFFRTSTRCLKAGDVMVLGPDDIHSVEVEERMVLSLGIHVYLGPLTTIDRSLFHWETGERYVLNDENYNNMLSLLKIRT